MPLEQEDALDDRVRVLHLADALVVRVRGEAGVAPVRAELAVQEVLVHRGELAGEDLVEHPDDVGVTLHRVSTPWLGERCAADATGARRVSEGAGLRSGGGRGARRASLMIRSIVSRHEPQPSPAPAADATAATSGAPHDASASVMSASLRTRQWQTIIGKPYLSPAEVSRGRRPLRPWRRHPHEPGEPLGDGVLAGRRA